MATVVFFGVFVFVLVIDDDDDDVDDEGGVEILFVL